MSLISASDLAWMQTTQQQAMPGTVVIERYTMTSDGMGGTYQTWAAAGTVIGRIYPRTSTQFGEGVSGAQPQSITRWFATMPVGTDVNEADRLVYASRTWEIIGTNNDESWQTAVHCEVSAFNEERRV